MIEFKNIEGIYFVGIGGIGMSALALYFVEGGYKIGGYDRSETGITQSLTENGCEITYNDELSVLPELFKNISYKNRVIIVYTPAIPAESKVLSFFRSNGYLIYKRSEILGEISSNTDTLAVAGTHGKTTVSTMIAHLLKQSHIDCSAFLGGISKNYNSNLLLGDSRFTVMEADEFDRSFHRLKPLMAVVTSLDADHLDIYAGFGHGVEELVIRRVVEGLKAFDIQLRICGLHLLDKGLHLFAVGASLAPEEVHCYGPFGCLLCAACN